MLEIQARSFQGRCVRWTGENFRIETPNLLIISEGDVPAEFTEALIEEVDELGISTIIAKNGVKIARIPGELHLPLSLEAKMISWEGDAEDNSTYEDSDDLAVLIHSFEMRRDARAFIRHIRELRQSVGPS